MRLLLLADYAECHPWSPAAWAADLAHSLHEHGHDVLVACDGADDPADFAPVRVLVRDERRTARHAHPLRFARWAGAVRARHADRACVSLTHFAPGDLWIPLGPPTMASLRSNLLLRRSSPGSMAAYLADRPWLAHAAIAERQARAAAARFGTIRGALNAPAGALPDGRIGLGFASRLPPPDAAHDACQRVRTRRTLGLREHESVVLLSGIHLDRPGLHEFLAGAAVAEARPIVLAPAYRGYRLHLAAERAGMGERVRLVGATARMDALFAAADLAAAPFAAPAGITTGRFVCDAIRAARPVLARADAPGAELIALAPETRPGALVPNPTPEGWGRAIDAALEPESLARARHASESLSCQLGLDVLVDRLVVCLEAHAAERVVNPA
ncbi:MAG: glycosyltransferase [Phycisphaeraceae bacterium]|nr:glycosyltransferase [Phycisphaeraceae bacterium]